MKAYGLLSFSVAILLAWATPSQAVLDVTLVLDNPTLYVGPTDTVALFATLTNESTSDETLFGSDYNSAYIINGTLVDLTPGGGNPYTISFFEPLTTFPNGVDLAPGESLYFAFATLIPDPAPIAPGVYASSGFGLEYLIAGQTVAYPSTTGVEVNVVPEPTAAVLLLLVGGVGLARRPFGNQAG